MLSQLKTNMLTCRDIKTLDVTDTRVVPEWLSADHENLKGTVVCKPTRAMIDVPVEETLIVELYSK